MSDFLKIISCPALQNMSVDPPVAYVPSITEEPGHYDKSGATCRHEAAGSMSESGIESMLDGLSWAEQMELEEQLAEAQGTVCRARGGC
jgi:hypothetical protein